MNVVDDRYRRVEAIYQEALDTPPDLRRDLLDRACRGDDGLRREVETLLEHYEAAPESFLDRTAHALRTTLDAMPLPERIGQYRILGILGEGGMGVVYRAEQDSPRREVALKVMRTGPISGRALHRFELEAAILGRLKHPGIAQIHEAGVHEDSFGRHPFFAMELVEGSPLTAFAQSEAMGLPDRLALMADVCDAVHYAHQKGVVHRDLKPTNILVVIGGRIPKVLDFGVALATDSDIAATTMHTESGQLIGTLPYMSPEQLAGTTADIDVRSDVYSLGAILYELLCGRVPFDVTGKTIAAAARIITEQEPAAPGTFDRAYRGDLDTIVLKALEKDPARRYQSASDLAADLRRYLRHEPIAARPATAIYHLSKFARRNRGLVTGASLAVIVLVTGAIVSTSLAIGQHRALIESEHQRRIAEAVNEFLNQDLLSSADPTKQPDRDFTVREVVDRASATIADRFPDQPLIEAGIRLTLSGTYKSLGEYAEAAAHAERALELYRANGPVDARDALRAANKLGQAKYYAGQMIEAERVLRDALASVTARFGDEDELTLSITNNLGLVLERRDRLSEAAAMFKRVLEVRMRLLGEEHKKTRTSMNNLAMVYVSMGRNAQAEPLHVRELELSRRLDGPEHPETLISLHNLAVLYSNRKEFTKAESLHREALEARERVLGPDHPDTLSGLDALAMLYIEMKRYDEAEDAFQRILETTERTLGPDHPMALKSLEGLSVVYTYTDRLADAESISRRIYEWRRRVQGDDHVETGATLNVLTQICLKQGKLEEAEAFGLRGYDVLIRAAPNAAATRGIATKLRDVYERLGRPDDAAEWSARAQASPRDNTP